MAKAAGRHNRFGSGISAMVQRMRKDGNFDERSDRTLSVSGVRLSDTDRLEAFSDGVLAITITLLVVDIVRPDYAPGHLAEKLQAQWPNYIAFLASFFYVGIIWLNHRAVFSRVRYCSRSLHLANLFLLLTTALIPFPTAVLVDSAAIRRPLRRN